MPLLTKAKQRTVISALRDSNVRDIEQNYNEPAKLWCNEKTNHDCTGNKDTYL